MNQFNNTMNISNVFLMCSYVKVTWKEEGDEEDELVNQFNNTMCISKRRRVNDKDVNRVEIIL